MLRELFGLPVDESTGWVVIAVTLFNVLLTAGFIIWVLMTKPNSTSAVAWCLLIIFLPYAGALFFLLFGYQHVGRRLQQKKRHKEAYRRSGVSVRGTGSAKGKQQKEATEDAVQQNRFPDNLAYLALKYDAFPMTKGNKVTFYHDGQPAYDDMLAAIAGAQHHVHLETFIFQDDEYGDMFLKALAEKAKQGVQVRLLYDAMGSLRLSWLRLRGLRRAGGKCYRFLPVSLLRRRWQVNLRNHRKIMVVDGNVAFSGGLNIGREYASKDPRFGYWRDTHFRIEGPAVTNVAHVFAEDWDFASGERLKDSEHAMPGKSFFHPAPANGDETVQVIESGPDQSVKSIREIFFAAILAARQRLWIATPYFIPDDGLLDALRLAGQRGVDVRLLGLFHPDKWIPLYAARYYWPMILKAGVKVYQYTRGMMHSKVMVVDDQWATVGSANLDNRSMYLNFEVNCLFYSANVVSELEAQFRRDLENSICLDREVYARRPFPARLLENACRLMSPVL